MVEIVSNPGKAKRRMPVEPVVALYVTGLLLQLPIYQHYLYHRAQEKFLDNSTSIANEEHCYKNVSSLETKVQQEASKYILALGLAGTFPSIFTSLLYGPLSDRKGRKPIMMLPLFGSVVDVTLTLFTIYYKLPIYTMAIGAAFAGLCGQFPTFVFTVTAYIADTTSPSQLPLRLTTLEALALLGGIVAQATSGLWIKHLGYAAPYWFMLACHVTAFVYTVFLLPESRQNCPENNNTACYSLDDLKLLAGVIVTKRDNKGRTKLLFLFIITLLLLLPVQVINQLVILFSKDQPLCWREDFIGYFLASLFSARAIGAITFMTLFKRLNWHDYSVAQIGTAVLMGLLVMIGLSTTTLRMFLSTIFALMVGLPQPCIKAQMSQIVNANEQGSLFSLTASLESICNFLTNIVFNPLYQSSLNFTWPHANGFVFFLSSGITIVPFIIISCLKIYSTKKTNYEVMDDAESECQQTSETLKT